MANLLWRYVRTCGIAIYQMYLRVEATDFWRPSITYNIAKGSETAVSKLQRYGLEDDTQGRRGRHDNLRLKSETNKDSTTPFPLSFFFSFDPKSLPTYIVQDGDISITKTFAFACLDSGI